MEKLKKNYDRVCISACELAVRNANAALFLFGFLLLAIGTSKIAFAQGNANAAQYTLACDYLLRLIEGPFGALVTAAAGIAAIIASALGGFKMAWTLVVVAVGAFILRAYITLFFAGCGTGSS